VEKIGDTDLVKSSSFLLMDKADEEMITNADKAVKEAMVYKFNVGGKEKHELTYIGLKHLTLLMSQGGQPLEVLESICEQKNDIWYASYKVRNKTTGHESVGISECPVYEGGKYDPFGRTKAMSKAERNAWRKQIPELKITELIKAALAKGDVKDINPEPNDVQQETSQTGVCHCPFSEMVNNKGICGNCGKPLTMGQINALEKK